uniref:Procollagen-proline, 2-oxoglutarate 4-dioxygenase (proline 4-hydroxylase), alpha polypeptide 2 n=1 Tax=Sinocyclocheilus grahami TaxID=75366 RepID=A0A672JTR1_SINGR
MYFFGPLVISSSFFYATILPSPFTGQMTDLIFAERELVQSLKEYIEAEELKLEAVKSWANKLDMLTRASTSDPEGFLAHPVNAYKLMKRLNTEWSELESLVLQDPSDGFISNMSVHRQNFPDDEDEKGAAKALMRLQDTYKLDSESFSKGNLPGQRQHSGNSCFHTSAKLVSTDRVIKYDYRPMPIHRSIPTHKSCGCSFESLCILMFISVVIKSYKSFFPLLISQQTSKRRSRLLCRYQDGNRNPRLLLKPMKEEDEWDSPHIVRFLEALSDEEIKKIKELAKPKLSRATVRDPNTGVLTVAHYRVSKSAWLEEEDDPVIARVNQRIEDVTGLSVNTAELLQVANYGVGGQYEPHYDFSRVRPLCKNSGMYACCRYAAAPQTLNKIKQVKAFFFSNYFPNLEIIFLHLSSVRARMCWHSNVILPFRLSYEGRLV